MPVTHDPIALLGVLLVASAAAFGWRLGSWLASKVFKA